MINAELPSWTKMAMQNVKQIMVKNFDILTNDEATRRTELCDTADFFRYFPFKIMKYWWGILIFRYFSFFFIAISTSYTIQKRHNTFELCDTADFSVLPLWFTGFTFTAMFINIISQPMHHHWAIIVVLVNHEIK